MKKMNVTEQKKANGGRSHSGYCRWKTSYVRLRSGKYRARTYCTLCGKVAYEYVA